MDDSLVTWKNLWWSELALSELNLKRKSSYSVGPMVIRVNRNILIDFRLGYLDWFQSLKTWLIYIWREFVFLHFDKCSFK